MPKVTLKRSLGQVVVDPTIKWASNTRMGQSDKAAIEAHTREMSDTIRELTEAIRELQIQLNGKTLS